MCPHTPQSKLPGLLSEASSLILFKQFLHANQCVHGSVMYSTTSLRHNLQSDNSNSRTASK